MKILKDSSKIMKKLLGKIEVIQNWCCWYEKILKNLFEILSVKLVCDYGKI